MTMSHEGWRRPHRGVHRVRSATPLVVGGEGADRGRELLGRRDGVRRGAPTRSCADTALHLAASSADEGAAGAGVRACVGRAAASRDADHPVERAIRPIALGRKNQLVAGPDGGVEHWAVLASLIATCTLNEGRSRSLLGRGHHPDRGRASDEPDRRPAALEPRPRACHTGRMTEADDNTGEIATVRIELLDTDPLIWRQVEVPTA